MVAINNLDKLADKIYQEGIERAEKESKAILDKAHAEHTRILENAQAEAREILVQATKEANRRKRSIEKELQLKGRQFISDLKGEIMNILSYKVLHKPVQKAFEDNGFMQSAILEAIASWKPTDDLELRLPKTLEAELDQEFQHRIATEAQNVSVTFDDQQVDGFRIEDKENTYQISFTDQDFIALFSPYLEEQTSKMLFQKGK